MTHQPSDYAAPIRRFRSLLDSWPMQTIDLSPLMSIKGRFQPAPKGQGPSQIVVGENVGIELGKPDLPSHALVLTTEDQSLVQHNTAHLSGPDFDAEENTRSLPFAQIILLGHPPDEPPDPFDVSSTQYLVDRLPGYMTRAVPGRLWARISREAIGKGFRMAHLAAALAQAYQADFPLITHIEIAIITGPASRIKALNALATECKVIQGQHRKLVLSRDGSYACTDMDCDTCTDQEVCDTLRDIGVAYRKRQKS